MLSPLGKCKSELSTYMSVLVQVVVGELQLVEGDRLLEPVGAGSRAVRVDVEAAGHVRLGLARHHPLGVVVLVAAVIQRHDVHEQDVLGVRVQPLQAHLQGREHPPASRKCRIIIYFISNLNICYETCEIIWNTYLLSYLRFIIIIYNRSSAD